jgi:hypothetical protein
MTWITQDPFVVIRVRLVRQREIPANNMSLAPPDSTTADCDNLYGYYQFPFDSEDISIIFAKGVSGARNVSYHEGNKNTGSIPLREEDANASIPTNTTEKPAACPKMFALSNYTYDERFNWPYVPRVCELCSNNLSNITETLVPISTTIQSSINSLLSDDIDENDFECAIMGDDNESSLIAPVCGCANELSPDVSIVFLVDAAGNQNDSDWAQFTWKILEGFVREVMLVDMNTSAITNMSINPNMTINDTIWDAFDVNVILYGGVNNPLEVHKLDWEFLMNISVNPIPMSERFLSNLCNATFFAGDYLTNNSTGSIKILVTIPWQDPSDELDCLVCDNCSLNGIHSFTAKVFDQVDLSLIERTFGGYSNCTYLYNNQTESQLRQFQEWPYVLAGISDFICFMSQPQIIFEGNFSLQLLMTSRIPVDILMNYLQNISDLIEIVFEDVSNDTLVADTDFSVECKTINETDILPILPLMYTVIIDAVVYCADNDTEEMLKTLAQGDAFAHLLNHSLYLFFQTINPDANAIIFVYSVDNALIFNVSEFTTTGIEPSTTGFISTVFESTFFTTFNMSTTYIIPTVATDSIGDKARRILRKLEPWMIAVIVIGAVLLCLLMVGLCALLFSRKNRNNECENDAKEQVPMIVTNTVASQYIQTTKSNNQYASKTARVANDDDQIYV